MHLQERRHRVFTCLHIRRARRGSSASRIPSPSRLTASTVSDRKTPGKKIKYPAIWNKLRPSAMMLPQLGTLGGVPAPMKDRIDSTIMAEEKMYVPCTSRGATELGRMWRMRM